MAVQNPSSKPSRLREFPTVSSQSRGTAHNPLLPVLPPLAPRRDAAYPRAVHNAPYTALRATLIHDDEPTLLPVTPRCRLRTQVGSTNRWRIPSTLGSDLLGINQAIRAIRRNVSHSVAVQRIDGRESRTPHRVQESSPPSSPPRHPPRTAPGSLQLPSMRESSTPQFTPQPTIQPFLYKSAKHEFKFGRHGNKVGTGVADNAPADVLLESLEEVWELHRPFLQKSQVLSKLLKATDWEQERSYDSSTPDFDPLEASRCVRLQLPVDDHWISKKALAVALSKLYEQDMNFAGSGPLEAALVVGVLGASILLDFADLSNWCLEYMLAQIKPCTVCQFHQGAIRYRSVTLATACERWLSLHLVPTLSRSVHIKHLTPATLQMILKSPKLFVTSEWRVYKTVCIWLHLLLNPSQDILPSWKTVVDFFANFSTSGFWSPSPIGTISAGSVSPPDATDSASDLPPGVASASCIRCNAPSFLESEEGQRFTPLLHAVRLHGVAGAANVQDLIRMNVVPQRWLLNTLQGHYSALHGEAVSSAIDSGNALVDAVRFGFVVKTRCRVSETILLHGFHFAIVVEPADDDDVGWSFMLERLRPSELALKAPPFSAQPVSLQNDCQLQFYVQVTTMPSKIPTTIHSGLLSHVFTLGEHPSRRRRVDMTNLRLPIYVMFAICLPD